VELLIESLWQGSILAILAGFFLRLLRPCRASVRELFLWSSILAAAACLFVAGSAAVYYGTPAFELRRSEALAALPAVTEGAGEAGRERTAFAVLAGGAKEAGASGFHSLKSAFTRAGKDTGGFFQKLSVSVRDSF